MSDEGERPLAHLNGFEHLQRITRLEEQIKALREKVATAEDFNEKALQIAQTGLDAHLLTLNGATGKLLDAQEKHAQDMLRAQALLQTKDLADRDKKELDARIDSIKRELEGRIAKADDKMTAFEKVDQFRQGKLALPMIVLAAVAAGLGAAAVKFLIP